MLLHFSPDTLLHLLQQLLLVLQLLFQLLAVCQQVRDASLKLFSLSAAGLQGKSGDTFSLRHAGGEIYIPTWRFVWWQMVAVLLTTIHTTGLHELPVLMQAACCFLIEMACTHALCGHHRDGKQGYILPTQALWSGFC